MMTMTGMTISTIPSSYVISNPVCMLPLQMVMQLAQRTCKVIPSLKQNLQEGQSMAD